VNTYIAGNVGKFESLAEAGKACVKLRAGTPWGLFPKMSKNSSHIWLWEDFQKKGK
jgi:hypothetical protein